MVHLVVVAHQAVVAGCFAVFLGVSSMAQVLAGLRVEVAQLQGCLRPPRQSACGSIQQLAQHARAAFGRLIEQDQLAVVRIRQRLCGQLVVLELVADLNGDLSAACRDAICAGSSSGHWLEQQAVFGGPPQRGSRAGCAARSDHPVILVGRLLLGPVAALDVQHKPRLIRLARRLQPMLIRQKVAAWP